MSLGLGALRGAICFSANSTSHSKKSVVNIEFISLVITRGKRSSVAFDGVRLAIVNSS